MFRVIILIILSATTLGAAEHSPFITDKQIAFFEEHRSEEFGVHGQLVWYKHLGTVWGTTIQQYSCLLYTSPSPRDRQKSRMPSSA